MASLLFATAFGHWNEKTQCRDVQKKRRGYRSGFADPMELLHSNKTWTADDLSRGSIESRDDLPEIEYYVPTSFTYHQRQKAELKAYKVEDCEQWDHFYKNITEMTREHYDFYVVDPETGNYQFKN